MKLFFCIFLLIFVLVPFVVYGQVVIENPLKWNTFGELLGAIIDFIFTISIPIISIMIIISGFYFISAQGDPEKIKTARKIIIWSLIGFIIIICAKGLVAFIEMIFSP